LPISKNQACWSTCLLVALFACCEASSARAQDADADGVPDGEEQAFGDTDADGIANPLDADDDGDTRPTRMEEDGTRPDRDGDGAPDYLDGDEDDDGLTLLQEDVNGDHVLTSLDDSDHDGLIDSLDADDDDDGLDTRFELGRGGSAAPRDSDRDGRPDYLDADDDGDGALTRDEREVNPDADSNQDGVVAFLDPEERGPRAVGPDLDGDGISDAVDPDGDGDSVPDLLESETDSDADGTVDRRDPDDDGDGVETLREYRGSEQPRDTDADGIPDFLDTDDDGDGVATRDESPDLDHDGRADDPRATASLPDYLNADDDGDGIGTRLERPEGKDRDSDADGLPDQLDRDDDGDHVETAIEAPDAQDPDTDGDGIRDHLDPDDDGDTLETALECGSIDRPDADGDGVWNCYDTDSDGDGLLDSFEGLLDTDEDGVPDYLDATATPRDSDRDGVADARECESNLLGCADVDGDGVPDYLDADDDGDGVPTQEEAGQLGRDSDADGTADYLDDDDDDDGVPTRLELPVTRDTDVDGTSDFLDADDDGDGTPTRAEGGAGVDSDADGTPDYLDLASKGAWDAGAAQEGGTSMHVEVGSDAGSQQLTAPRQSADGCTLAGSGRSGSLLGFLLTLALGSVLRRRRGAALTALVLLGCGDDDTRDDTVLLPEAGIRLDAAAVDASMDARAELDAQVSSCMSGALSFETGDTAARSFSAIIDKNRVQLAFISPSCGGATSYGQGKGVRRVSFGTSGDAGAPEDVDQDACAAVREPTLLSHGDTQLALFFGSSRAGNYDLFQTAPGTPAQLLPRTDDAAFELLLAAAALGSARAPFLAYASAATLPSSESASIQLLGAAGAPSELLPRSAGHRPSQLSLVRREDGTSAGTAVLAWVSERPETAGVYLRLLSDAGASTGEVVTLTQVVGPNTGVAVAARSDATGIVYTEAPGQAAHRLRYRGLKASGALDEPVALTSGNQDVLQFALSSYRNGFAVLYRTRSDSGQISLRLLGFDTRGNPGASATLATTGSGTAVQLLQGLDGRLIAIWDEPGSPPEDGGPPSFNRTLRVARASCF
jgi:hypothetical protein